MTGLSALATREPVLFLVILVLLIYSVIAHEVAHGWVAGLFGDDTARRHGRLTANPLSHIDPVGTLMLLVAGFGWARPVPVNYAVLRHSRWGLIAVALAGITANILIAAVAVALLQSGAVRAQHFAAVPLAVAAKVNIALAAFNLIPIPPLDGSRVLGELLPPGARASYLRVERYGFFILIALLMTRLLDPVIDAMQTAVTAVIALLLAPFR
jgi:Zn-dependent protease